MKLLPNISQFLLRWRIKSSLSPSRSPGRSRWLVQLQYFFCVFSWKRLPTFSCLIFAPLTTWSLKRAQSMTFASSVASSPCKITPSSSLVKCEYSVGFDFSEVFDCGKIGADSEVVVLSANTNTSIRFLLLRCRLLDFRALRLTTLLVLLFAFVN